MFSKNIKTAATTAIKRKKKVYQKSIMVRTKK
jgi:hypothetical protein